jgi:hypothetical protein
MRYCFYRTREAQFEREVILNLKKRIPIHCEHCIVKLCLTEAENESEFCGYSLLVALISCNFVLPDRTAAACY